MARAPVSLRQVGAQQRITRSPQYPHAVFAQPFAINPFFIAPVLPGETMTNLQLQCRAVTEPITSSVVGWWLEHYIFYVKHSDLDGRTDFQEMMLDTEKDLSGYHEAAAYRYYHGSAAGIPWAKLCLKRVVEEYFRNEGEAWDVATLDGLPAASINQMTWLDSVTNSAEVDTYNPDMADVGSIGGVTITPAEVETEMRTYLMMRMQGLTDMSYEDYLATFGVPRVPEASHIPELLRYSRSWQYPSNTIDPSTGAPTSAVSWAISERADKNRYFSEPGFIFGVVVPRPKVYIKNQNSTATRLLDNAYAWLPATLQNDPAASLKEVSATTSPLIANTDSYWVDLRDLFLYGEQYVNFNIYGGSPAEPMNVVALPTAGLEKRYPSSTDTDGLFVNYATGYKYVTIDGVVRLSIKGSQRDHTLGNIVGA